MYGCTPQSSGLSKVFTLYENKEIPYVTRTNIVKSLFLGQGIREERVSLILHKSSRRITIECSGFTG